ncbi:hypothetical protein [Enterococcus bulliens]
MSEIEKLAKELQDYTISLGSHKHIQNVSNRLVELTEQPQLLGVSRVVQYEKGNVKVQVSEKLNEDLAMHITFLAMNVEALANKLRVSTETVLELVKENIETELMMFNLEQEEE